MKRKAPMKRTGFKAKTFKQCVDASITKKKTNKKKKPNRQKLTKQAKERVWQLTRKLVIMRDGGECVVCEVPPPPSQGVHVHHWIVYDARCARARYLPDNLVSLCSTCHRIKIHREGDAQTYDLMKAYMIKLIGVERYEEIKMMKFDPIPVRKLEDFLEMEIEIKGVIDGSS